MWKPGSTVVLKSGGPVMTVTEVIMKKDKTPLGKVRCTWFNQDGKIGMQPFPNECLRKPSGSELIAGNTHG